MKLTKQKFNLVFIACAVALVVAPAMAHATDELPLQAADAEVVEVALPTPDEVDTAAAVTDDTYAREAAESAELGDATERIESAEPATPESDPSEVLATDETQAADEPADTSEPGAPAPETPASDTGSEQPIQNDTSPQEQPSEPDTPKQPDVQASSLKNTRVQAQATRAPQAAAAAYKAPKAGWVVRDGKTYYYTKAGDTKPKSGWLVTNTTPSGKKGSLQRYWLGADGVLATSRLVTKAESGYWAYAKGSGEVVRGRWTDTKSGYVYLANNDGKLENTGWRVTKAYDGHLERYWVDKKAHAAIPGFSAEGYDHFTIAKKGFVARGKYEDPATGYVYLANNDGKLESPGWHVTKAYDGHLERYYIDKKAHAAIPGFSKDGYAHVTLPKVGYVARGVTKTSGGTIVANNDGLVLSGKGWVVTNKFAGRMQRYYFVTNKDGVPVAKTGHFTVEGEHYYGIPAKGYVLRGKMTFGKGMLLADNDGKLIWTKGWVVTRVLDGRLERYYINGDVGSGMLGARLGLFKVSGKQYFGRKDQGYVVRNATVLANGSWYHGDNDGVLTKVKAGKVGWQNPSQYYQVSALTVILPDYSKGIFAYVSPSQIAVDASRADCVEAFIGRAYDYLGTTYVWDYACAPGVGVDCAGLVLQCMYAVGIKPNKYTPHDHYYTAGHDHYANDMSVDPKMKTVSFADRKRGDLIFYPGHVAIYLGNDQIIHAYPGNVHTTSVYFKSNITTVKRVFV